jgi:hypothetical protein
MKELDDYNYAKHDLECIKKNGLASFMDVSVRIDRLEDTKQKLIYALGRIEFDKLFEKDLK